ncbi:(deoxy)nucleoside triphosphate pyrophosphohydrolase [Paenibacillus sp. MWE-103]|uniref:8-oxo-dGTP diphosphatase n=1 Tax=Paenibacillus artemisiicola TaxID=1172618 RepID=A0ABS3WGF6_9BACL|nr:(deoxy)nucleoside triphosphate pyrophosphohydrolase [Paenibacillus artemisiicola]MBO7747372.1 (deoxy)nucleoside triphosphate pyrophosphohydrolase [Paenibacillus artemisiicola]
MTKTIDVVGAVIVDDQKRILCAKRSERMSMPFMWEFPGGKIEQHEEPEAALAREISEELNCQIEVREFITEAVHSVTALNIRLKTYYARIVTGIPQASEHEELRWVLKDELTSLNWAPADIPTVEILQKSH